ncbi:MAG: DUF4367 domain-containing protein [Moorellaceae bacterium]
MKQYTDEELDTIIGAVVKARVEDCTPPPVEEAWARFKRKMNQIPVEQGSSSTFTRRMPRMAVAVALLFLVATVFTLVNPGKVGALGYKVKESITVLLHGSVMNLRSGVSKDDVLKLSPPSEGLKEIPLEAPVEVTLEEAREQAPFPLKVPAYLPEEFQLLKVTYQKQSPQTAEVVMQYKGPEGKYCTLTQFNFIDELGTGYAYDREDTVIREVMIGPCQAQMAEHKSGLVRLMWIDGHIKLELQGKLTVEEAIKIGTSIY